MTNVEMRLFYHPSNLPLIWGRVAGPDLLLRSHLIRLFRGNPEAFQGQQSHSPSSIVLGLPRGLVPEGWMAELLTPSLRESPDTLQRKLILAACTCQVVLLVTT